MTLDRPGSIAWAAGGRGGKLMYSNRLQGEYAAHKEVLNVIYTAFDATGCMMAIAVAEDQVQDVADHWRR